MFGNAAVRLQRWMEVVKLLQVVLELGHRQKKLIVILLACSGRGKIDAPEKGAVKKGGRQRKK
jgi:hypothetical protein